MEEEKSFQTCSVYIDTGGMDSIDNRSTPVDSSLRCIGERCRVLLAELATIGLVSRGPIASGLTRAGDPTCRDKADPPVLHGHCFSSTRKVARESVSTTPPPDRARRCLRGSSANAQTRPDRLRPPRPWPRSATTLRRSAAP